MRFGVIKTLVENKLVQSFKNKKLKNDMSIFKNELLSDNNFKKMMFIYDSLNENKSLDGETANYLIDDLVKEFKQLTISEKLETRISKWTAGVVKENKYSLIDDLIYGDSIRPEKKSIARKQIVESLGKTPIIKESKPKVPIKSMLKIANNNVEKMLQELNESDREKVIELFKSEETLLSNFESIKESTIKKIDKLIVESDEELKKALLETKERVENSKFSKKEYLNLLSLDNGLII